MSHAKGKLAGEHNPGRHRELERHSITNQPLHHGNQRQISFGNGLEKPVFLEKLFMLRVANEWQVRVKNERKAAGRHFGFRNADCGKISGYRPNLESHCSFFPRSAIRNPKSLERPAKILKAIETFLDHVDAGRVTEAHGTIVAKRDPGDYRDVCLAQ